MAEPFKTRMRRLRLRAGLPSQKAAADVINCERGTVGMWEAPSSRVDAVGEEYLLAVARAYRVRPEYINSGKGDDGYPWSDAAESQPVRLDVEIVRDVAQAIKNVYEDELHQTYSLIDEPEIFVELYERVVAQEAGTHSQANVIWLGRMIERVAQQGAQPNEERPDTEHSKPAAHHKGSHKAKG